MPPTPVDRPRLAAGGSALTGSSECTTSCHERHFVRLVTATDAALRGSRVARAHALNLVREAFPGLLEI
jgi:hypothetical protein